MTPPWAVGSPMRAAGRLPISTVGLPGAMTSGGPVQVAMSVARAAGRLPISTVGQPGGRVGPPTWGTVPGTIGPGGRSLKRAAGRGRRHGTPPDSSMRVGAPVLGRVGRPQVMAAGDVDAQGAAVALVEGAGRAPDDRQGDGGIDRAVRQGGGRGDRGQAGRA